jgi:protein-S-isoprenylcysteine O-methyltransferase
MLATIQWVLIGLFPVSEIVLAIFKRADPVKASSADRGSMRLLWLAIGLGVACAIAGQWAPAARLRLPDNLIQFATLAFLLFGLTIRWSAIITLGRFFTVNVAIRQDHALVQHGLYRYVRHPSYSGLLLAFIGLGLVCQNWLSLIGLMTPVTLAVINRIGKEERALLAGLGQPYADYCVRTKRLFPGLV